MNGITAIGKSFKHIGGSIATVINKIIKHIKIKIRASALEIFPCTIAR